MSDRWTIEIVCTDRGQHKPTWMTRFIWNEGHGWSSFIAGSSVPKHEMFGPPNPDAEPGDLTSRESYGFACSRCSRWPRIHRSRWLQLMDAARHADMPEFDVSYVD